MFRIGEFSKIAQVAGSQLRYYDEIGLLNPARIDEWTGYRYYSAQQLPRLNRILALKGLGLSLDQIRSMLDDDIPVEEIRGMFSLKKAQLEQSVQEDVMRLHQIESRIQQIEETGAVDTYEILLKSVPALPYLAIRDKLPSFGAALSIMMEMQHALPEVVAKNAIGNLTAILHSESFGEDDIDLEIGYIMLEYQDTSLTLPSNRTMTMRTLPAVEQMITTVFVGLPQTSHTCRAVAASWIESNGYELDGHGREIFIVPPLPGKENETVIEIQYPVTKLKDLPMAA